MTKANTTIPILNEWDRRQREVNCLAQEGVTQEKAWTHTPGKPYSCPPAVCPPCDMRSNSPGAQGTWRKRDRKPSGGVLLIYLAQAQALGSPSLTQNAPLIRKTRPPNPHGTGATHSWGCESQMRLHSLGRNQPQEAWKICSLMSPFLKTP